MNMADRPLYTRNDRKSGSIINGKDGKERTLLVRER